MISSISHNPYLVIGSQLRLNQSELNKSLLKLTSGLRINSPSDGAGSYFIASELGRRATSTRQIVNELSDNIEALKSSRDVLVEIKDLLDQMSDLADDAAAESNAAVRLTYANEYDEIQGQIDTLVTTSSFNGTNLLSGDNTFTVQVDENTSDTLDYTTLDTVFDSATGLNLGANVEDYTTATGVWDGVGGQALAQNYADSIDEGVRTDAPTESSGLSRINRNINRLSNTINLLEGRQTSLLNKVTNYEAAQSSIVGINEAEEATRYSALQIKQQAGAYFLASANTTNQVVSSLIYGYNGR